LDYKLDNSFELFYALKKSNLLTENTDEFWWPNSGSFEVIIGAILTQNTKWANVQKALNNLTNKNDLETIVNMDTKELALRIKPSGFYNTKAKYLKNLAKNIYNKYESFELFCENTTRQWLLENRGIGQESADSILCYACKREEMVADAYSHRLLLACGIEFESYEDVKEFLAQGICENIDKIWELYGEEIPLNKIYARFHGKIVNYCANNSHKKTIDISKLQEFLQ